MAQRDQAKPWDSWLAGSSEEVQTFFKSRTRRGKKQPEEIEYCWYVVEFRDTHEPQVTSFVAIEGVQGYLRDQLDKTDGPAVFIFWGVRAHITGGSLKYLVHPDGTQLPLFILPEPVIDPSGRFGEEEKPLEEADRITRLFAGDQAIELPQGQEEEEEGEGPFDQFYEYEPEEEGQDSEDGEEEGGDEEPPE